MRVEVGVVVAESSNWVKKVWSRNIIELGQVKKYTKLIGLIKLSQEANVRIFNSVLIG